MECKKYEIIEDGGRKRIRSLRDFTVQDRHVCIGDLGGYVYDDKTLGQNCPAWIFSGSLEYPGIHVYDEAIVDMGSNEPFDATARMKRVLIHGKSRIMGMMQFTTGKTSEILQIPAMYEQGYYEGYAGVPFKAAAREASDKVRSKAMVWSAGAGKVIMPNENYEIMCNKLDEDGITLATTAWRKGGVDVSIDLSDAAAFVLNVRKVGGGDITPADITEAGFSIQSSAQARMDVNNTIISASYDRSATPGTALRLYNVISDITILDNSEIRIFYQATRYSSLICNCEMYRSKATVELNPTKSHSLTGVFRDVKGLTLRKDWEEGLSSSVARKVLNVSNCDTFVLSKEIIPAITDFTQNNASLVFRGCNVPVGIFYYDHNPGGNVYTDIDFSKASEHLGKTLLEQEQTILVSSNVEGMYRLYRNADDKVFGMLVQDYASVEHMGYGALESSYDSVVYSDCVLDGVFNIIGCNVFGGTLGGASKVHSTSLEAVEINGNFRVEGNAQIEDTPLKGTGYIGGNAELKNGNVEGYIYMDGNAKYIPEKVEYPSILKSVVMRDNSKVLRQRSVTNNHLKLRLYDNATINSIASTDRGTLIMRGNSYTYRANTDLTPLVYGTLEIKDDAKIDNAIVTVHGDVQIVGSFNLKGGTRMIYGKHVIASPDDVNRPELPPTKATW
jgi:hypothetical protein|nr:MAG TPA: Putative transferase, nesg, ydcK, Structural Genomics.38A [Caudoviricetes sp.]